MHLAGWAEQVIARRRLGGATGGTHLRLVPAGPLLQLLGLVQQVLPPLLALLPHRAETEEVLLGLEFLGCGEMQTRRRLNLDWGSKLQPVESSTIILTTPHLNLTQNTCLGKSKGRGG